MRYLTAGESHGKGLVAIIDGFPAGVRIDGGEINRLTKRRMLGYGRGGRMSIEADEVEILSGVDGGYTTAAPIALSVKNADCAAALPITAIRPGHADYAGLVKYGFSDARIVAERASARESAITAAVGACAYILLKELGVKIFSRTVAIGGITAENETRDTEQADLDPVRCLDPVASKKMTALIDECKAAGDTLGGVSEIIISGLPVGIGSYAQSDLRLSGRLFGALGAIRSVKAVEIGDGVKLAALRGSAAHDAIYYDGNEITRKTNRAGGIEGGISNGEDIVVRLHFKPIPSLKNGLDTVDIKSGKAATAAAVRSDVCIVPAGGVVAEAVTAITVLTALQESLGGDTLTELKERFDKKLAALKAWSKRK